MKIVTCFIIGAALVVGCGKGHDDHEHDGHAHKEGEPHSHAHNPKHGGQLVEIGEEACHLEFARHEWNASRLKIYVHQFHPTEKYLKLATSGIRVIATVGGEEKTLDFKAVVNRTFQNNATHSSEYEAGADWLKGTAEFEARVVGLMIGGKEHNKTFKFGKKD